MLSVTRWRSPGTDRSGRGDGCTLANRASLASDVEGPIELALQRRRDVEILYAAAPRAHQVVVVTRQLLGELVPAEAVLRGDPADRDPTDSSSARFRYAELCGRFFRPRTIVGKRERHPGSREDVHEPSAGARVSLPRGRQTSTPPPDGSPSVGLLLERTRRRPLRERDGREQRRRDEHDRAAGREVERPRES